MIHGPDTMRLVAVATRNLVCRVQKTQTDDLEIIGELWCGPPRIFYAPKKLGGYILPSVFVAGDPCTPSLDPL